MIINSKNTEILPQKNIVKILKGSILSISITLIVLFIFAVILAYTNVPETIIIPSIIVISSISILLGSIVSSIKIKKQGIINGATVGGIYIIVIYILSSIFQQNFNISTNTIILIISGIISGAIGGVIGVNLKHRK